MTATLPSPTTIDIRRVQRRTLTLLSGTQIIGGIGVATGISVGALLAADMAGAAVSGLAGSCAVIGAALVAIPATRIMRGHGRRPGLAFAYLVGLIGATLVVVAAMIRSVPLLLLGTLFFGGSSAANLQARYTAIDLAEPDRRARQLSLVVWVTTVGVVLGPNMAPLANNLGVARHLPEYTGPYVLSAVAFGLAALLITLLLRPDPLLLARTRENAEPTAARGMWREAARTVAASPGARLGITAVAIGHVVMVGVMSMTPVYIGELRARARRPVAHRRLRAQLARDRHVRVVAAGRLAGRQARLAAGHLRRHRRTARRLRAGRDRGGEHVAAGHSGWARSGSAGRR